MRSNTIEARAAKRPRIILLIADGESNRTIGELVDLHYNQVGNWRKRSEEFGPASKTRNVPVAPSSMTTTRRSW